jgi:predicted acyl esterase
VLTFTSPPLPEDLEIAGPIKLELYASSSAVDTDFFIKLSDQFPQPEAEREQGRNPHAETVSRGWLKASHRELDPERSTDMTPYHTHGAPEPLVPGTVYCFDISIEPMAYLFAAGHRIRLEIVNGDSPLTELLWTHYYRPDKIGTDTIYHDAARPSVLILPVDRRSGRGSAERAV